MFHPPLPKNQAASSRRYGLISSTLIEVGTFQNGLNTISCISSEKTGVCLSGLPTTTRVVCTVLLSATTRSVNSGMLTVT